MTFRAFFLLLILTPISPLQGADKYKANNTTPLNAGGSWTGGVVAGTGDVAVWDSRVLLANAEAILGGNLNWQGIRIANPAADVVIGGTAGQTLTLTDSSFASINLAAASADLTLNTFTLTVIGASSTPAGVNRWNVGSGRTLNVNCPIGKSSSNAKIYLEGGGDIIINSNIPLLGGAGGVVVDNAGGTATFNGNNLIGAGTTTSGGSGFTLIDGTVNVNTATALGGNSNPITPILLFGGNLGNTSEGAIRLMNVQSVVLSGDIGFSGPDDLNLGAGAVTLGTSAGTTRTLTVDTGTLTLEGVVANGATATGIAKRGPGTLVLSGANSYTGGTGVFDGTLEVSTAKSGGGSVTVADAAKLVIQRQSTAPTMAATTLNVGSSAGATLAFTLPEGNPTAALVTAATLNLTGLNTIEIEGAAFSIGRFPLIRYTNLSGAGSFASVPAIAPPGFVVTVENNALTSSIDLVIASATSATQATLSVSPDSVQSTESAQPVTLTGTASNVPPDSTYQITSSQAVTYPNGGENGPASNGTFNLQALVDGTTASTVFTLNIYSAQPQLLASAEATVTRTLAPDITKPNVLVIMYDDTGWGDFGCYGSPIRTPNIDSLAAGGLRFREFHNTARCSTTRCALMTGNYNQQVAAAVGGANPAPTLNLPDLRTDNNITIAELLGTNGPLGPAGYRTYKAGKWHMGAIAGRRPTDRGFEHNYGTGTNAEGSGVGNNLFGYWDENTFNIVSQNNEIAKRTYAPAKQFHYSDGIGDYCVDFVNHNCVTQNDGRPFFVYMPFHAPHFPVTAPAEMVNRYTDVGDPNPEDVDIIRFEDGWDVIRQQNYQRQLSMGVLKPGTLLSPKGSSEWIAAPNPPTGTQAQIDDWNTLNQAQRNDLARRQALFAAAVELNDINIGKVVNRLKELGQFDNTLIFVLCDNGGNCEGGEFGVSSNSNYTNHWATADLPAMSQPKSAYDAVGIAYDKYPGDLHVGAGWANVSNVPFRLYKHYQHNGGIRSPLVVSWPAGMAESVKGAWTDERGHLIDIMATIQDVTGVTRPTTFNSHAVLPLQGTSLKPTFTGRKTPPRDIGFEHEKNRAYIRGKWKLVTKVFAFSDGSSPANELELYDLEADPTELSNQALNQPAVLAEMVDAWNAWCKNVTLPASFLLPAISPPQLDAGPITGDLFVDNFNRANDTDIDALATGMSGSRVPPMGGADAYDEGREAVGTGSIAITNSGLRMAVGGGTCESGLRHNFTGTDITDAGGFTVQMRIDHISTFPQETENYAGFGVGLTQAEAAAGADIATPGSFRGKTTNPGVADCFVELDALGNLQLWSAGVLRATAATGSNRGTLIASFATTSFNAGSVVTVTVLLDGQVVDLDPQSPATTRTFTWSASNTNFIGLSARATDFVKLDNLAIRAAPVALSLATEYAGNAGIASPLNSPDADPDGDLDNNLVEWLKGGQPEVHDSSRKLLMLAPTVGGEFRFNHYRLTAAAEYGVTYLFKYSTDLVQWSDFTPETQTTQADNPGYELIQSRIPPAIADGHPRMFVQLIEVVK
jgi:autotransporter-associated beta strand protein